MLRGRWGIAAAGLGWNWYRASKAQAAAAGPGAPLKPASLAVDGRLRRVRAGQAGPSAPWSPEQIAARPRVDFPDHESMRPSHGTDHQSCTCKPGRAAPEPTRRAAHPASHSVSRAGAARPRQPADPRPSCLISPATPRGSRTGRCRGHWEGDLILGAANASAVATWSNVSNCYVLLGAPTRRPHRFYLSETPSPPPSPPCPAPGAVTDLGPGHRNGPARRPENRHRVLDILLLYPEAPGNAAATKPPTELLRQYLPKGSDLSCHAPDELAAIAAALDGRPCKTHPRWEHPGEALNHLLTSHDHQLCREIDPHEPGPWTRRATGDSRVPARPR